MSLISSKYLYILFAFLYIGISLYDPSVSSTERVSFPQTEVQDSAQLEKLVRTINHGKTVPPDHYLWRIAETIHGTTFWFEDIDPVLVARLVRVESGGDTMAISSVGAVGLGQIRPEIWLGEFPQCGDDLWRVRDNICYTTHILNRYKKRYGNWEKVLLSYVGCRNRYYSCVNYPTKVRRGRKVEESYGSR